jgi:DNA-binding beta-propeller fold protein YncE
MALVCMPASARAAGQIGYDGCLANDASDGCGDLFGAPLGTAARLATSPAGDLYSTGRNGVLHFFAAPQGQISYDGCVASDATDGCVDLPFSPLFSALGVAVSPDGGSVYVVGGATNDVGHFVRAPQGQLTFAGCIADDTSQGCTDVPFAPLNLPTALAVSPDGAVYVTSAGADSVSHFFTNPQGSLFFRGCLANTTTQGCGAIGGGPLAFAGDVAASPDGKSVYVTSYSADAVSRFDRLPGGGIAYQGCWGNDSTHGCADLPSAPLDGAWGVAVSPDGNSVYVASRQSDSVAHFFRGADGALSYDGCVADSATGCADLPQAPIEGAAGVAVSPDGKSVYVAAPTGASVGHFFRAPQGQITWDGCLNDTGSQNCGDLPGTPLSGAWGLAVSPNGGSVYVGADATVAHFFRSVDASAPPGSVKTPGGAPGSGPGGTIGTPGVQRCFGKRATIVGTQRSDRLKGTRRADVIVSLGGNDRISGGAGNDLICAGAGNDKVSGGAGNDRESGGPGNDSLKGDAGKDSLKGDAGKDLLSGGPGKDGLTGGSQKDRCTGGAARDRAAGCERKSSL